jgi:hypothetical protein
MRQLLYNLKGIAPPRSPSSKLGRQKSDDWLRGANIETGGRRVEKMYQEIVYYNRIHVKTRLSQSILSKIVCWSNTITLKCNLIRLVDVIKLCTQLYFHNFVIPFRAFCIILRIACNLLSTFPRIFHKQESDDDNRRGYKYAYCTSNTIGI